MQATKQQRIMAFLSAILLCLFCLSGCQKTEGEKETGKDEHQPITESQTEQKNEAPEPVEEGSVPVLQEPEETKEPEESEEPKEPAEPEESDNPETSEKTEDLQEPEEAVVEIQQPMGDLQIGQLVLPRESEQFSMQLALQLLPLCSGHLKEITAQRLTQAGFEILLQENFDKSFLDQGHTCAFTVGKQSFLDGDRERSAILVAIRGTNGGEWYSNFDVAPSRNFDTEYAENFLASAQNVLEYLQPVLDAEADSVLMICGHSRGAACANLLGMLLDEQYNTDGIYVYTYATPTTVRGEHLCQNVFNVINPCDLVPQVPLSSWGFHRVGTDVLLPSQPETEEQLVELLELLSEVAPDIRSYYEIRHPLLPQQEMGLTPYELMNLFCGGLSGSFANFAALSIPGILNGVQTDSDYVPLIMTIYKLLIEGDGSTIALNHMPDTYMQLMRSMIDE